MRKKTTFKKGNQITSGDLTAVEAKQRKANTDPVIPPHLGVTKDASVSELKELISWHKKRYDDDMGVQGATIGSLSKTAEALKEKLEAKDEYIDKLEEKISSLKNRVRIMTDGRNSWSNRCQDLEDVVKEHKKTELNFKELARTDREHITKTMEILKTVQSILNSLGWIAKILKGKSIGEVLKKIDAVLKD